MQDIDYFRQFEPFFDAWYITRLIGEGGFGKVFEIERRGQFEDKTFTSALKVIAVPSSDEELKSVMTSGMDQNGVRNYFYETVKNFTHEITIMNDVKGHSNIVSYEDHRIVERTDGFGWYIFIRMELLTPISRQYENLQSVSEEDVVRLGCDLCKALEDCQKFGIIHRDIKPDNIFISKTGDYKLGDFGIACIPEKGAGASTQIGTPAYVAPEVLSGQKYGSSVDTYSLGLVMYQLLNDNRMPFCPPAPQQITPMLLQQANRMRLSGKKLPPPVHGSAMLQRIVLKACEADPKKRYTSPAEMHRDLLQLNDNRTVKMKTIKMETHPERAGFGGKKAVAAVLAVIIVGVAGAGIVLGGRKESSAKPAASSGTVLFTNAQIQADRTEIAVGETTELALKDGEYLYRREEGLEWSTEDESVAAVSSDGVVTGIGDGLVTIKASYQGKTAEISIHVTGENAGAALEGSMAAPDETPPESLQILTTTSVLVAGDSILPALKADNWTLYSNSEGIAWETSDQEIADVKDGVLTARKAGDFVLTATYRGKSNSVTLHSVDAPVRNDAKIDADYDSITLVQGGEDEVEISFSGNIPEKFTAMAYDSAGMNLSLRWGEMRSNNSAALTISDAYSQQAEGEVTVLCCAADDPSSVAAVKKIRVRIKER